MGGQKRKKLSTAPSATQCTGMKRSQRMPLLLALAATALLHGSQHVFRITLPSTEESEIPATTFFFFFYIYSRPLSGIWKKKWTHGRVKCSYIAKVDVSEWRPGRGGVPKATSPLIIIIAFHGILDGLKGDQ